jgi:hypothetical protein
MGVDDVPPRPTYPRYIRLAEGTAGLPSSAAVSAKWEPLGRAEQLLVIAKLGRILTAS